MHKSAHIHLLEGCTKPVLRDYLWALAGVAQWIDCQPVNRRVTGSIPSQVTCLGCELGPQ